MGKSSGKNRPPRSHRPFGASFLPIEQATILLIGFRLILSVAAIAIILIWQINWTSSTESIAVYVVVVIACALNIPYFLLLKRTRHPTRLVVVQVVVDMMLVTMLVFYTGGIYSLFTFFYFAPILAASGILSSRASLIFASLAVILLSGVSIAYGMGLTPNIRLRLRSMASESEMRGAIAFHLSQSLAFFLVSLLSARLVHRLGAQRLLSEDILDSIGQGILVLGPDGRVEYANTEIKSLLGLERDGLLGRHPEELFRADGQRSILTLLEMDEQTEVDMDWPLADPSLPRTPLRIKTTRVRDTSGTNQIASRWRIIVFTDLTLQRRAESAILQAERSEAISELARSIAHELRNPLASIRGAVQEVRDTESLSSEKIKLMNVVLTESDRLDRIISAFLDFSRMGNVRKVRCNLSEIMGEVVLLLRARDDALDKAIDYLPQGSLDLSADPDQLRQVFLNLGLNSLDALQGAASPAITIRARPASYRLFTRESLWISRLGEGDRPGLIVEFKDNGRGMDENVRIKAFDPFYTTRTGGSGLGLAVVDRIVRAHGGQIDLRSTDGFGTTFRIWLPST